MKWRPTTGAVCLLIALALALAGAGSPADAGLAEASAEQLAEAIGQLEADERLVAADERRIMAELGASMPDGVAKNQLRRMNMKHILHLEGLERLQAELARRRAAA